MNDLTRSERLRIWMRRMGYTQESISEKLGITRQTLILRMKENNFRPEETNTLKTLGFEA